jgi:hypothetical protein
MTPFPATAPHFPVVFLRGGMGAGWGGGKEKQTPVARKAPTRAWKTHRCNGGARGGGGGERRLQLAHACRERVCGGSGGGCSRRLCARGSHFRMRRSSSGGGVSARGHFRLRRTCARGGGVRVAARGLERRARGGGVARRFASRRARLRRRGARRARARLRGHPRVAQEPHFHLQRRNFLRAGVGARSVSTRALLLLLFVVRGVVLCAVVCVVRTQRTV